MSMVVQQRGAKFQLRVKHKLLSKPFIYTFDDEGQARAYGDLLVGHLKNGVVPVELLKQSRDNTSPLVLEVIRAYTLRAPITASDDELLSTVINMPKLKALRVADVTFRWAEGFVLDMKAVKLKPGTIRKRIGVLARVLDWHFADVAVNNEEPARNPLRQMPHGYSTYPDGEVADEERDLRLTDEAAKAVAETLAGVKRDDRERPWPTSDEFRLFFDLIIETGLRLSEAYRLRVSQFDVKRGILNVEGSKGHRNKIKPRTVPLKPAIRAQLVKWCDGRVGLMFSFWNGQKDDLRKCTSRLSAKFGTLFDYAKVPQMTEHDLRHEACCRWITLRDKKTGGWMFNETEVCKIMGWNDTKMMLRYASLRGEDWADRLSLAA